MRSTHYSKLKKTSTKTQVSHSPSEDAAWRRVRASRQTKPKDDRTANTDQCDIISDDEGTDIDLIDLAENEQDADPVAGENEVRPLEGEEDEEVTELGEVSCCSLETTASGPCSPHPLVKRSGPPGLCSDCQKLYQKARKKKMRLPLKDNLLDNDSSSLTCDQWVLLKMWTPNRLHHMRGRLSTHLPFIRRRLDEKQVDQCVEESEQTACSRPHTFLQRNLRRCVKTSVKSGRRKTQRRRAKRSRSVQAQGPRLAKQRRLHSASLQSDPSPQNDSLYSSQGFNSDPGPENGSEQEDLGQQCDNIILQVIPSSVTMETPKPAKTMPKQVEPRVTPKPAKTMPKQVEPRVTPKPAKTMPKQVEPRVTPKPAKTMPKHLEPKVTPKPAKTMPKQVGPKKRGGLSFRDLLAQLPVKSTIVRGESL